MADKALVIESDPTISGLLDAFLRRQFAFDVLHAHTILEGVDTLKDNPCKAVIVDISVSAEGLVDLTAQTYKHNCAVLVLTTGRVDRKALELFVHDHVYAVFPKPFDIDELGITLTDAIEFAQSGSRMSALLHGFLKPRG
jgi:DNA-binding NtrC family response regulator